MSDTTAPEEPARAETILVPVDVPSGLLAGYDAWVKRDVDETWDRPAAGPEDILYPPIRVPKMSSRPRDPQAF